jgi:hypothetical protein
MTEFGRISDDVKRSDCIFFEFQRCRRILDISLARDKAWSPLTRMTRSNVEPPD